MKKKGWIGVDLDATLAMYKSGSGIDTIGDPIPEMVRKVKEQLANGVEVRIVTARVASAYGRSDAECSRQKEMIREWTLKHIGRALEATNEKDFQMVELWDDRARQVCKNNGMFMNDKYEQIIDMLLDTAVSAICALSCSEERKDNATLALRNKVNKIKAE